MGGVLGIIGPVNSLIDNRGKVDLLDRGMMTIEYSYGNKKAEGVQSTHLEKYKDRILESKQDTEYSNEQRHCRLDSSKHLSRISLTGRPPEYGHCRASIPKNEHRLFNEHKYER